MSKALEMHEKWQGKIEVVSRVAINNAEDLSVAYTPGVAEPCKEIHRDAELSYKYTRRGNLVAVITDGSAVLGLGNIGGLAGMPVMEGKCALFKEFAGVDAFPICIKSQNVDEVVNVVANIADSFGGINLEDISAPRCFEIESKLKKLLNIPVFHDDQHGTAIVCSAALKNSLKVVGKQMKDITIVIVGAGAAGTAIGRLMCYAKPKNIIMVDINGIINKEMENISPYHAEVATWTNRDNLKGGIADAIKGADVVIGVAKSNIITPEMVSSMARDAIVFAMSNPVPEIMPNEAKSAGARIVGTGRSDYPNQINNVLAFPGIFKGALQAKAMEITENMKLAAVEAIASLVTEEELNSDYILPKAFDVRVAQAVADAIAKQAVIDGVIRK